MKQFIPKDEIGTEMTYLEQEVNLLVNSDNSEQGELQQKAHATISVIIPVFQEEKILEHTLSKYTDDLKNKYSFEVIISDGGSTDSTIDIADNYCDKIIVHSENRRQTISEGRNKGAEIAQGEVLIFINGDTYPSDLEKFFEYIYTWSKGKGDFKDCQGLTCWVSVEPKDIRLKDKIFYALHNRYIKFLNFIGLGMGRGECQIIKKDYFNLIGGYDEKLAAGEDFDLFKRLAKISKIGFISDLIVYESPRRFRKYGYFKVIMSWLYNSISVILYGKSISDDWEPVR